MTDQEPPGDEPGRETDDQQDGGLLGELPRGLRWAPLVLVVVIVGLFELLAPDTFHNQAGAFGLWGTAAGLGLVVALFVVVAVLVRRGRQRGDD